MTVSGAMRADWLSRGVTCVTSMPYVAAAALALIGLYIVLFQNNLLKMVIGLSVLESGINLFIIALGYRIGGISPIYTMAPAGKAMVLPVPQALCLTAIVIGFATTALALAIVIGIYKHYGTLDAGEVRRLRG